MAQNRIQGIEVLNEQSDMFTDFNAEIIDRVIGEQRVDIDVVSVATVSSKAFLKAVENALVLNDGAGGAMDISVIRGKPA